MIPKNCSVEECDQKHYGRGLCRLHYQRVVRNGTTGTMPPSVVEDRFWSKVSKSGSCWQWMGEIKEPGYGRAWVRGKRKAAHRASYEFTHGPIPDNLQIDHTCHNPGCVNPSHLRPVTNKQNQENATGAQSNSESGIRGVSKAGNRWRIQVKHRGKQCYGGLFGSVGDAEKAAIALRNELFTHNDHDRKATP